MTDRFRVRRPRRALAALLATLAVGGAAITTTDPVAAEDPPPPPPVFEGGYDLTPLPGYEEYAGCPLLNAGSVRLCLAVTVNGDLQLGNVAGTIEDLTMVMGISAGLSGDPLLVPAVGGGGPAAVPVPGGILGIPALDPIIALDPLQLLSLSATPQLGELTHTGLDQLLTNALFAFTLAGWPNNAPILEGDDPAMLPAPGEPLCFNVEGMELCDPAFGSWPTLGLGLPLTLKLNNTLLGPDCTIGPIDLQVTSGTTTPPAGVEPMTGSSGVLTRNVMDSPTFPDFHIDDIGLVGNTFEVPGSQCAGIAGLGKALGKLLGKKANPFDAVVNSQAGLPAAPGASFADLSLDLHVASQEKVYGAPWELSSSALAFGSQQAGTQSAPQTVTVTNRRSGPRTFTATLSASSTQFTLTNNQCTAVELQPGESCTVDVAFKPTSAGNKTGFVTLTALGELMPSAVSRVTLTGTGTA